MKKEIAPFHFILEIMLFECLMRQKSLFEKIDPILIIASRIRVNKIASKNAMNIGPRFVIAYYEL